MSLKVGSKIPKFSLLDQDQNSVSSNDLKGQYTLFYFYPKAMTPGCTTQACMLTDFQKEFKKRKIVVFGVSPDSVDRLIKFREKENINFSLLSDAGHEVAEAFGAWGNKKFMGKSYDGILRKSFLIGPDLKVIHIMEKVNTKTHHQDVLDLFDELI